MKGKNKKLNEMLQQKGVNSQKSWSKQIYIHVYNFFRGNWTILFMPWWNRKRTKITVYNMRSTVAMIWKLLCQELACLGCQEMSSQSTTWPGQNTAMPTETNEWNIAFQYCVLRIVFWVVLSQYRIDSISNRLRMNDLKWIAMWIKMKKSNLGYPSLCLISP